MLGIAYGMGAMVWQVVESFAGDASPIASTPVPAGTEYLGVNELSRQMALPGGLTSVDLVTHLQERIRRLDPQLSAIIELNPKALETARELDRERANGNVRGPLHGIPILLKDTIETEGMQTSAGAFGLVGASASKNAPLVDYLIQQGAVILGKTNMTEMAGFRGAPMVGAVGAGRPATLIKGMPTLEGPAPALPPPLQQGWRPWRWGQKPTVRSLCRQRATVLSGSSPLSACWIAMELFPRASTRTHRAR